MIDRSVLLKTHFKQRMTCEHVTLIRPLKRTDFGYYRQLIGGGAWGLFWEMSPGQRLLKRQCSLQKISKFQPNLSIILVWYRGSPGWVASWMLPWLVYIDTTCLWVNYAYYRMRAFTQPHNRIQDTPLLLPVSRPTIVVPTVHQTIFPSFLQHPLTVPLPATL